MDSWKKKNNRLLKWVLTYNGQRNENVGNLSSFVNTTCWARKRIVGSSTAISSTGKSISASTSLSISIEHTFGLIICLHFPAQPLEYETENGWEIQWEKKNYGMRMRKRKRKRNWRPQAATAASTLMNFYPIFME